MVQLLDEILKRFIVPYARAVVELFIYYVDVNARPHRATVINKCCEEHLSIFSVIVTE